MKRIIPLVVLLLLGAPLWAQQPGSTALEAHVHYAWANVTRVDPIYGRGQESNSGSPCAGAPMAGGVGAAKAVSSDPGGISDAAGHAKSKLADKPESTDSAVVKPCSTTVSTGSERSIVGYNVEYRYRGNVYVSRLDYDPGERLRVRISVRPAD